MKLKEINKRIDMFKSLSTNNINKRTKKHYQKRCSKLRAKIKNKVNDLHWQSANYICKHFKNIFIPNFNVKPMIDKSKRNLSKNTVRTLLNLSHYKFRTKLMHCANKNNRKVIICTEQYTSKTCSKCGVINKKLGSKKIFECSNYLYKVDRDINGAINICIRQLMSFK